MCRLPACINEKAARGGLALPLRELSGWPSPRRYVYHIVLVMSRQKRFGVYTYLPLVNCNRFLYPSRMAKKNPAAVSLGRRGGKATAERGPEYFKKIQAMRKNRKGGRPKKS